MLAFGVRVPVDAVYTEGIRQLSQTDILFAREFGYEIKLLAIAKQEDGLVELRVHPTMVPQRSLLAGVGGAYNAIFVQGQALGSSLYFWQRGGRPADCGGGGLGYSGRDPDLRPGLGPSAARPGLCLESVAQRADSPYGRGGERVLCPLSGRRPARGIGRHCRQAGRAVDQHRFGHSARAQQ